MVSMTFLIYLFKATKIEYYSSYQNYQAPPFIAEDVILACRPREVRDQHANIVDSYMRYSVDYSVHALPASRLCHIMLAFF